MSNSVCRDCGGTVDPSGVGGCFCTIPGLRQTITTLRANNDALEWQLAAANRQIDLSIKLREIALAAEKAAREKAVADLAVERKQLEEINRWKNSAELERMKAERERDQFRQQWDELAAALLDAHEVLNEVSMDAYPDSDIADLMRTLRCRALRAMSRGQDASAILAEHDAALIEARVRPLVEAVAKIRELVHMWADEKSSHESVLNHIHSIAYTALAPYQSTAQPTGAEGGGG